MSNLPAVQNQGQQVDRTSRPPSVIDQLKSTKTLARVSEVIGPRRASLFVQSVIQVVTGNEKLRECSLESIMRAAFQAAALNLDITPAFGFVSFAPRRQKVGNNQWETVCVLQPGWKGYIQLALRSNKVAGINVAEVYEGEMQRVDRFQGKVYLDETKRKSGKVTHVYGFIRLLNGFFYEICPTYDELIAHGLEYSPTVNKDTGKFYPSSLWVKNPIAMCKKTVVLRLMVYCPRTSEINEVMSVDHDLLPEQPQQAPDRDPGADKRHAAALWGEPQDNGPTYTPTLAPEVEEGEVAEPAPVQADAKQDGLDDLDLSGLKDVWRELWKSAPKHDKPGTPASGDSEVWRAHIRAYRTKLANPQAGA